MRANGRYHNARDLTQILPGDTLLVPHERAVLDEDADLAAPATDPEMHSEANKATTHEEQTDPFRKDVNNE